MKVLGDILPNKSRLVFHHKFRISEEVKDFPTDFSWIPDLLAQKANKKQTNKEAETTYKAKFTRVCVADLLQLSNSITQAETPHSALWFT